MQTHNFEPMASNQTKRIPARAFTAHGCDSLATFEAVHKGAFLNSMPDTHQPCRDGFRPYRTADGTILGVKL